MTAVPMLQPLLPYSPERDVYRLLGVRSSASTDEITAACRRLARTFHPDYNPSARATAEMQVVNTVRRVLTDPESRALYDHERRRFHEFRGRVAFRQRPQVPFTPVYTLPGPPSPLERYARATVVGVRVTVAELLPARCPGCRAVIMTDDDAFCAACGARLPSGG
jgi:curved DNA-binding protein CbpA